MISNIYWINEVTIGDKMLGIMPRPRGNDWLEDEIKWLKIREIDCLVSLLEADEINELKLEKEAELCQLNDILFINFPIKDVNVPKDANQFLSLINQLNGYLNGSKKVVIHCRMGIGRSSVVASAILIKRGSNASDVFDTISKHRQLEVPDTMEQKEWIFNLEEQLLQK